MTRWRRIAVALAITGDFATVERVGDNDALTVRMDNGREVTLDADGSKHIDYGYTVENVKRFSADRIVLTGDSARSQSSGQLSRS